MIIDLHCMIIVINTIQFYQISSFNGKIKINKWLNILTFNRYVKIKKISFN